MHTAFTSSRMMSAREWKSGESTQDEYHIHFIIASMTIIRLIIISIIVQNRFNHFTLQWFSCI